MIQHLGSEALTDRAYSKRGVQPKCGVQEASCGV